uniref:Uncharacterized protein n=1 Tax=Megaselia scalaris TaxID=36166 RepID=T1GKT2_MEGSC
MVFIKNVILTVKRPSNTSSTFIFVQQTTLLRSTCSNFSSCCSCAPASVPFSVPAVSPLSYTSPVAKYVSPYGAAPFAAPLKYAAPAAPFVF